MKVTLRDGTVHTQKVDQPYGRTSANPLTTELLKEKFVNCAKRVLPEPRIAEMYAAIEKFERLADVRELTALTSSHQKSATRTALAASA